MICVISCLADRSLKGLPSAPRRAPSAGRRELRHSWDRRRSRLWSRSAAAGPATCVHCFSNSAPALFSSARHCRSVVSKLKLSPIFAAARQAASTLRVGTLSATVMSSVPANARSDADGNIRGLLPSRAPDAHPNPSAAAGHSPGAQAGQRASLHQVRASRSAVAAPRQRRTFANSWPKALRDVLLYRGRRWRAELAAVEHGVVALLALLKAHRGREHVRAALRLLELVHPPIRDLTGTTGILRAGSIGSVDDRNALHLVAIVLRIRPGDTDGECRPFVIQGKSL